MPLLYSRGLLGWPVELQAISNAAYRLLSDRRGSAAEEETRYVPCKRQMQMQMQMEDC